MDIMSKMSANPSNRVDAKVGAVEIREAFARPAMHLANAAAAFMTIENTASAGDAIVGISSSLAGQPYVHGPGQADMATSPSFAPVDLPAGGVLELKPGQMHMMLPNDGPAPAIGDKVSVTVVFAQAGTLTLNLTLEPKPGMMG